ncbi:parB-like nuclease domain protein [Escherichia coli 2741950]|nr:parB-like nuclease domain protein [Escherichia coli 2741950]
MSEKLKIVYRPLQELSPYAHNARTHSTEQVAQLVESIKQFGWTNPVLIDEKGEIIAGHGRVMAAEMLKMDSVPVIVLSGLTDEQKKAYRLADNRLPMNAGWDEDLLRMELSDLINADFDVSLTGFGPTQIDELLTDVLPGTGNKEEGNTNISGVTVVFRAGEQEQTPPEGFESSGSETVLGTEVKYDTPITRTITSANIDRLRFTFGVQALVETTSKGDRNPSEVRLLVQIQRNGGWVTEKDITIKGKTTSQYLASVVVDNLPPRPFSIRMRRMTPDSTTDQLQNKTLWSSYTEIIDVKQCYPNTALFGVQVDSEQFGSQQVSRNYHLRGRILQVPSNYNPQTRQYSGIWDGTFKPAYSNNMAWCMWDMLTHPRYGMGKRLGAADVDKWALYVIGQMRPVGAGGFGARSRASPVML